MRFVNGTRAEDLAGIGLVSKQRMIMPLWASVPWLVIRKTAKFLARLVAFVIRHPLLATATGVLAVVAVEYGRRGALGVAALGALGLVGWMWRWPSRFQQHIAYPAWGTWRYASFYLWRWYPVIHGSKLTKPGPDRIPLAPKITRVTSTGVVDTLHVRLLHGHTPEHFFEASEGLRHAFKAHRLTVIEDAPGRIRLRVFAKDPLAAVVPATPLDQVELHPDLAALIVGISEEGRNYLLQVIDTHTLVAGCTGAGKSSLTWAMILALAPLIGSGLVRVTGIDPKGGMELFPGRPLFSHYADGSGHEMADVLDSAVERMTARKTRMRDMKKRSFIPTLAEPFELVVIDELAWLTAYNPDKRVRDRVKAALSLLTSQGRAVGFSVYACLQDPRKEVLSFRDLFPTRIALGLAEDSHVDMVLGDGAFKRGAACHLIPRSQPGVGYVHVEGAHEPVRVRFAWITDEVIAAMVDRWPAPPIETTARVIDLGARDRASTADLPDQWSSSDVDSESSGA